MVAIFASLSLLSGLLCLLMAAVVFYNNPSKSLNRSFALFCLFTGFWALGEFMHRQADSLSTAELWMRIVGVFWPFAVTLLFHSVLIFTGQAKDIMNKTFYLLMYTPTIAFSIMSVATNYFEGMMVREYWGYTKTVTNDYPFITVTSAWAVLLGIAAFILCLRYFLKSTDPVTRNQAKYMLIGLTAPIVDGIITEGILPQFHIAIPELTTISMLWACFFFAYAMRKHELFVINNVTAANNIVATMSDCLFLLDHAGNTIVVNKAAEDLLGYDRSDLVGKPVRSIFTDGHQESGLDDLIAGKPVKNRDFNLRASDGATITVIFSSSALTDKKGSLVGIVCIARDITERKRIEEALRESEAKFKAVFMQSPVGIEFFNSEGSDLIINKACLEIFGVVDPAEIKALDLFGSPFVPDAAKEKLRKGETASFELSYDFDKIKALKRYTTSKSGIVHLNVSASPVYLMDGVDKASHYLLQIQDITNRKQAEEALRESEERFSKAFHASPDAITISRMTDGILLEVNDMWEKALGYSRTESVGTSSVALGIWKDPVARRKAVQQLRETGSLRDFDAELVRKTGEVRQASLSSELLGIRGEECLLTVIRDTTERKKAEEALRQSEEKLHAIFDSIGDSITIVDVNGNITDLNDAAVKLFGGKSKEALLGMKGLTFIAEDDQPSAAVKFREALPVRGVQYKFRRIDGSVFWGETSSDVLRDKSGAIAGFIGIVRDITERKQAEEALRLSEEKYRTLTEATNDIVYSIDNFGNLTFIGPQISRYDVYPEKMIGRHFLNFVHPDDSEKLALDVERTLTTNEEFPSDFRILDADGNAHWLEEIGKIQRDSSGAITGITGILRDITERKRADEALRLSEERFRIAAESTSDCVWELDIEKASRDWFGSVDTLLGYNRDEFPRTNKAWENAIHPEDRDKVMALLDKHLADHTPYNAKYRIIKKDGSIAVWVDRGTALPGKNGKPYKMIGVIKDITENKKAEDALMRVSKAVESSSDAIGMSDPQGHHFYHNKSFTELFEYTPVELEAAGGGPAVFIDKNVAREVFDTIKGGDSWSGEVEMVSKSGRRFTVLERADAIKDEAGKVIGLVGVHTDITERKRAEEAIKRSEEKYRLLAENLLDVVWTMDTDLKYTYISPSVTYLRGYSVEEAMAQSLAESMTPDSLEIAARILAEDRNRRAKEEPEQNPSVILELELTRKDGSTVWTENRMTYMHDSQGCVTGYLGISHDITKRRQAEVALKESEERFKIIFENAPDAYTIMTLDGAVIEANKRATELTGYSMEEVKGKNPVEMGVIQFEQFQEKRGSTQSDPDEPLELIINRRDGSKIAVESKTFPMEVKGQPLLLSITRDITKRRKMEDELTKYREHLEELVKQRTEELDQARIAAESANKSKSDFLANMSHEIRTPLNSIIGFSETLYDEIEGPLNDEQKKHIGIITSSGHHLLALINDILDLSKVEAGKMELSPTSFSMREVLTNSLSFFKEKAVKHNLRLSTDISADVDMIEADERKVKQIINNLLSNSVKFTPDGGSITLGSSIVTRASKTLPSKVHEGLSDMEYVLVTLKDTGIGIAKKDREKLFKEFSQIEDPYTKKHEGTGLGLVLSKKMVELHGGKIWFESEGEGKGCTFYFVLPTRVLPKV